MTKSARAILVKSSLISKKSWREAEPTTPDVGCLTRSLNREAAGVYGFTAFAGRLAERAPCRLKSCRRRLLIWLRFSTSAATPAPGTDIGSIVRGDRGSGIRSCARPRHLRIRLSNDPHSAAARRSLTGTVGSRAASSVLSSHVGLQPPISAFEAPRVRPAPH